MARNGDKSPPARRRANRAGDGRAAGFTLVELLVVVGIIGALAGLLIPTMMKARQITAKTVCASNIRLLQLANQLYERDNQGHYAPGSPHMVPDPAVRRDPLVNKVRWFGKRTSLDEPFSRTGGPLSEYLPGQMVKGCPSFEDFARGFEAGCGGYGYNNSFVGQYVVRSGKKYKRANPRWHLSGNRADSFFDHQRTVAFTDTAFVDGGLIEYSFCESPTWPLYGTAPRPTIHFRHLGKANVVWLDMSVTEERMTFSNDVMTGNPYSGSPADFEVGWFGPRTNELFDCE